MIEIEWTGSDEAEVFDGPDYLGFIWWDEGEWVASTPEFQETGGFDDEMQAAQWLASTEW